MSTVRSVHACPGINETGLVCEQIEIDKTQPGAYPPIRAWQWRLHVVSAGNRPLLSLIVEWCPFCGEHLLGRTDDARGVVLS